ncbi:MAG: ABC transporter permease [Bacteroidetes bacterium]|nr:MAG: ABC transporter permease [Bacteroidota bacterium]REK08171.1 MAG: ABC transporter permease [Bacteroidota bacterium]REK32376.1 MAG: ABC transporter permease [Bacteroidota bacterium]REK49610.1 MAG: ABC transporter permease [Bacteroidota bacterium]
MKAGLKQTIKDQFWNKLISKPHLAVILAYITVAICAPLLAGRDPLIIKTSGEWKFPGFSTDKYFRYSEDSLILKKSADWKNMQAEFILFPLVPYDPNESDMINYNYLSPFDTNKMIAGDGSTVIAPLRFKHWLGTDKAGRDVLSGLIHGTRTTLLVGFLSMIIALVIGLITGTIAGYFGDKTLKTGMWKIAVLLLSALAAWYYIMIVPEHQPKHVLQDINFIWKFLLIIFIIAFISAIIHHATKFKTGIRQTYIPADIIISRSTELFQSVPRMILILAIAAIMKPGLSSIIIIIGITSWVKISRLFRAEILSLKNKAYIDVCKSMGMSDYRIILRHILPNSYKPAFTAFIFGIAATVMIETGLSFLGIGTDPERASWGILLFNGKENFGAWWLVIFPGLAISALILALNGVIKNKNGRGSRDSIINNF